MKVHFKRLILCTVIVIVFSYFINDKLRHKEVKNLKVVEDISKVNEAIKVKVSSETTKKVETIKNTVQEPKKEIIFKASESTNLEKTNFKHTVQSQNGDRQSIELEQGNTYSTLEGVTCFRGNNMRDGGSYGYVNVADGKLEKSWEVNIGAIDSWSGVGWNGQPAIVKWSREEIEQMNIYANKKKKENLTEVIYAALDGYVHFIDLEDGTPTREKLNIGAPVKGSLTIDPRGYPILYVGQGINKNGGRYVDFAYRIFSLIDFKKLYEIRGVDNFAVRKWGAFDSTSIIDKKNDFFFVCGENGVFYSGKLNTKYEKGKVSVNPVMDKYKYQAKGTSERGIENSIAIYKSHGFFADNDGILQCLDLKTLKPVWSRSVNDDTDSTIVLEEDNDGLSLYTACEVDNQGSGGYCYVRKINAADGKTYWENKYKCFYDSDTNGGALATAVMGKGDMKDIVVFNVARTEKYNSGILVALDKKTGKEVWKLTLESYCWSSPVALYSQEGKGYIVQCDSAGNAFLIEGVTGKILDTINVGSNVEGTPAAFNNKIVVGTRGCKVVAFEVK